MGVVVRQGFKFAVVSYLFMGISILAVPFLYARNQELYGLFTFFLDTCKLLTPFLILGMSTTVLKFFPEVKQKYGQANVLFMVGISVIILMTIILLIAGIIGRAELSRIYADKSKLIAVSDFLWLFIPLGFCYALQQFLKLMISNYNRIAFPKLVSDSWRITSVMLFILVIEDVVSVQTSLFMMIAHFTLAVLVNFIYLNRLAPIRLVPVISAYQFLRRRDVRMYSLYALFVSMGSSLAFNIDSFMITTMLDASNTGAYTIANRIGSVIAVPGMAMIAIVTPIVAKAMSIENLDTVHSLYRRSSEALTIAGVFLLAGLAVIVGDLFSLIHNGSELIGQGALIIIGLISIARLFDMMTSLNSQIISLSEFFRYNLIFLSALGLVNIVLNYIFINQFGIRGAAIATFISLVAFNTMKLLFIRYRLQMWPFSMRTIGILLLGVLSICITWLVFYTLSGNTLILMLAKGAFVVGLFTLSLLFTRISSDFNDTFYAAIRRVRAIF